MPTYEYRCKDCGEELEVVQSFTDDPLTECPTCHGPLRKVFGNIGITFKGSGFYKTDSRSSSKAKSASATADKSDKPSDKSSEKSSDGPSTDTKSDTKKDTPAPAASSSGEAKSA
jgi:putative FmdB family regulatory protein